MSEDERPDLTKGEKVFVGSVAAFAFCVSLGFVIATVGWGLAFPAVFVAISLSTCIACIVYAFLGGVAGAHFSIGTGLKLAGSLAAIAAVYYLISDPLEKSMNDAKAVAVARTAADRFAGEHAARVAAEQQVQELRSQRGIKQSESDAAVLARIRESTADDDLGRGVINIYRNHLGPFRRQTVKLKARFLQDVPDGSFRFCHGRKPELLEQQVVFEVVESANGESKQIPLNAGGDIGPGACQVIEFDVQLGCDAATELLGLACASQKGVAWPATADNRIYEVFATRDPDFD